jgi:hypothetical protein
VHRLVDDRQEVGAGRAVFVVGGTVDGRREPVTAGVDELTAQRPQGFEAVGEVVAAGLVAGDRAVQPGLVLEVGAALAAEPGEVGVEPGLADDAASPVANAFTSA